VLVFFIDDLKFQLYEHECRSLVGLLCTMYTTVSDTNPHNRSAEVGLKFRYRIHRLLTEFIIQVCTYENRFAVVVYEFVVRKLLLV